ncbi:hypothetical protein KKH27_14035 [bacterium]|nr:hypothetical protein [bacterium]
MKPLESLVGEIKTLIEKSRKQVAVTVNATMTMLYWEIGRRINPEENGICGKPVEKWFAFCQKN